MNFYNVNNLLKKIPDAQYYIIVYGRGNGKTYSCLKYGIENYFKSDEKEQMAYIRRMEVDFKGKRGAQLFANHEQLVEKLSNGKYNRIIYYGGRWFMAYQDPETKAIIRNERPFAFAFSLASMTHDKSISYNDITTTIFDEFIQDESTGFYLANECQTYFNTISTIIRNRDNVKNFLCGIIMEFIH